MEDEAELSPEEAEPLEALDPVEELTAPQEARRATLEVRSKTCRMDFMMNKPQLFHLNALRNIDNQNPKFMRKEGRGFPSLPLEHNE